MEITKRNHFRYFMVGLCMLTQAIPYEMSQTLQPLFIHPIVNTFHFNLASYTFIFTIGAVISSCISPLVGKSLVKVNFKLIYFTGIILASLGYCLFGVATRLPEFYVGAILCMIGATFFSTQGIPWVINHWFPGKSRGAALGIAFCGGSISNIFFQPITQAFLSHYMIGNGKTGHLTTMKPFFAFALGIFVIGTIITLLIRLPKKGEVSVVPQAKKEKTTFIGWTTEQVLKIKAFWIFELGYLLIGFGLAALNICYAAFLDTKLPLHQVGWIGSVFGIGCLIGNISGGYLFDKLGTAKTMLTAEILYILAIVMMILISQQAYGAGISRYLGMGFGLCSGLAVFSYTSAQSFMAKDLFGSRAQGVMLGYIGMAYALGFAVGAPVFSLLQNLCGFTIAWTFTLGFVIVGFCLLISAVISIKKLQ